MRLEDIAEESEEERTFTPLFSRPRQHIGGSSTTPMSVYCTRTELAHRTPVCGSDANDAPWSVSSQDSDASFATEIAEISLSSSCPSTPGDFEPKTILVEEYRQSSSILSYTGSHGLKKPVLQTMMKRILPKIESKLRKRRLSTSSDSQLNRPSLRDCRGPL